MMIHIIEASDREALEDFFLTPEGILPNGNTIDNNTNKIRFAYPAYGPESGFISLCCFENWKEITEEYMRGTPALPPLDSRLAFDRVIYDGKILDFPDTFEDVLHYAFRQTGREDIPEPYPKEPSIIARFAYELYKIDWVKHISPAIRLDTIRLYAAACAEERFDGTFDEYVHEYGYNYIHKDGHRGNVSPPYGYGAIYASCAEFLDAEYRDTDYMKKLFTQYNCSAKEWGEYLGDIKKDDLEEDLER